MRSNLVTEKKWGLRTCILFGLGKAPAILLALYGLKCIVCLSGSLTEPHRGMVLRSFYLAPVKGKAAWVAGLGYIALALFGYLSCGPRMEDPPLLWRMGRGVIRWGSLAATYFLWHESHKLRLGIS